MNEHQRFHRTISKMEQELPDEDMPLDPDMEDRLVSAVLRDVRAQRNRRMWQASGVALALAACLGILLLTRPGDEPMPHYALNFAGSGQVLGSSSSQAKVSLPDRILRDTVLQFELVPEKPLTGTPAAQAFVRQGDGFFPVGGALQPNAHGLFRLTLSLADLPSLHPGPAELVVTVGRSGSPPSIDELKRAVSQAPAEDVRGFQVHIVPFSISTP
jgi:hypothetical protein